VRAPPTPPSPRSGQPVRGRAVATANAASAWVALGGMVLTGASCAATRTLEIRSEPPGAHVRLDQKPIGTTPLTLEFHDYGTHQLTFHLQDHCSAARIVTLEAPWQARFPLDILTEVLVPVGWTDRHELMVRLEAGTEVIEQPDLRFVLERAQWLRTAGPNGPGSTLVGQPPKIEASQGSP